MTQMGMILGTAAYMSPEQAKGRQADKRSDVWAFGAVLYEMLSGQRAFKGDDISDTLAAVLRQDIDWTALPASTPAPVRRLMARCLDRDVRRRLRDIGEARIVLDDPAAPATRRRRAAARPRDRRSPCGDARFPSCSPRSWPAHWPEPPRGSLKPSTPLTVTPIPVSPAGRTVVHSPLGRRALVVSPDGTQMVYVANSRLYLRSMSELDVKAIQGTESYQAVTDPVFSPDGRSVAFYAPRIRRSRELRSPAVRPPRFAQPTARSASSWGPDGIVFGQAARASCGSPRMAAHRTCSSRQGR